MKNKDLSNVRPIYIHEANYSDEEISLIDLVLVLIKRIKLISMIFVIFIALGYTNSLFVTQQYTYSTTLEIGNQMINGSFKPFESPQTLLAKLEHSFIPQVLNEQYRANSNSNKQYNIKASIPKDSAIIVLETNGAAEQSNLMTSLILNVVKKVSIDHKRIYDSVKQLLSINLKQATAKLESLKTTPHSLTEIATQQNLIDSYSSRLTSLHNTHEMSAPMQSLSQKGAGKTLVFVITILAGLFVAIFAAFFAEFVSKVREVQASQ